MKLFWSVLVLLNTTAATAQSIGQQDIEPMLRQMQESGKISAQEAAITRQYMQQMKPSDWKAMEQKAHEAIQRNPAAAERVGEEGIDALNGEDFGITKP